MRIRSTLVIFFAPLWVVSSPGCTPNEEAPLEDGLRLEYRWKIVSDTVLINMTAKKVDEDHFVLEIESEKSGETGHTEVRVDRFFQMESGKPAGLGETPFWMPPSGRRAGADVVPDGSIRMRKEKVWEGWNVWVGTGGSVAGSGEWYYERDTGFLVGFRVESMGSGMSLKLLETNAPGL